MPFVILNADARPAPLATRSMVLRGRGYVVKEAAAGRQAIAIAAGECLTAAVIGPALVDMTGFDLARQLKADLWTARVPLVHVARESNAEGDRAESSSSGAETCLAEPVDSTVLAATIQWLAAGHGRAAPEYLADRWRAFVETVPQLLRVSRADGWTVYLSPHWVRYTGGPEWRHQGFGWLEAVHPDERDSARSAWMQALACGGSVIEQRLRGFDGEYRRFRTTVAPVLDEAGEVIRWLASSEDIEEAKVVEDELRKQCEELRQANAELRELVREIGNSAELLRRDSAGALDERAQELIRAIASAAERAGVK